MLPGVVALLVGCAPEPVTRVGVYAVWLEGTTDEDRDQLDAFFTTLLHGSDLNDFFLGEAELAWRGSLAVPPPDEPVAWNEAGPWLNGALVAHTHSPLDDEDVFVVFASGANVRMPGACGRSSLETLGGNQVGVAWVQNYPLCWPTRDRVRTETQVGMHELVEATDRLLGYAGCAGDGTCEGKGACPTPCDGFVGLVGPGAPERSWTGCSGESVEGWVIQRLAHEGRYKANCETCMPCDFTPTACAPDDARCGKAPPRSRRFPWVLAALGLVGGVGGLAALRGWTR